MLYTSISTHYVCEERQQPEHEVNVIMKADGELMTFGYSWQVTIRGEAAQESVRDGLEELFNTSLLHADIPNCDFWKSERKFGFFSNCKHKLFFFAFSTGD